MTRSPIVAILGLVTGCTTTSPLPLGPESLASDVVITAVQSGWIRIDPSACILKPPTGPTPSDDRECSGQIDLNGDGRPERLTTLYAYGRGARLALFDGAPGRTDPILEVEGYALMATTERRAGGWPVLASYGDPVSAEERIGTEQTWNGTRFQPES